MYRMCQNKTKEIVVNFMIMLQTVLMVYSWWVFFTYFNAGIFFLSNCKVQCKMGGEWVGCKRLVNMTQYTRKRIRYPFSDRNCILIDLFLKRSYIDDVLLFSSYKMTLTYCIYFMMNITHNETENLHK